MMNKKLIIKKKVIFCIILYAFPYWHAMPYHMDSFQF